MTKTFTVRLPRVGGFPMDMLRFDHAWPENPRDAALIEAMLRADDTEITKLPRIVEVALATAKHTAPTLGRWMSFGVAVVREMEDAA